MSGEINITTHNDKTIEINETKDIDENNKLVYKLTNNDLYISFCKKNNKFFSSFNRIESKELTVKIPNTMQLSLLNVKNTSADININNINTNSLKLSSVSGDIELINTNAHFSYLNNVSGDIDINGTFNEQINTNNVSGDTNIENNILPKYINTNSVSGDISIYIFLKMMLLQ